MFVSCLWQCLQSLLCLGRVWVSPAVGAPGLWCLLGSLGSGWVPGPRTQSVLCPKQPDGNKSQGFVAGGRDPAPSQLRWCPQPLGAVGAGGQVSVLPRAQVRFPTGFAGLAPALCLVNKILFGINAVDLPLWSLSWRGMPRRRRRREWDVLNRPNTRLGAQLSAQGVQVRGASLWGLKIWEPWTPKPACDSPRAAVVVVSKGGCRVWGVCVGCTVWGAV